MKVCHLFVGFGSLYVQKLCELRERRETAGMVDTAAESRPKA